MSNTETKTCSITEDEIHELLAYHGRSLGSGLYTDEKVERINYLNRRLKAEPKNNISNVPALPEPKDEGISNFVRQLSPEEEAAKYSKEAVTQEPKTSW